MDDYDGGCLFGLAVVVGLCVMGMLAILADRTTPRVRADGCWQACHPQQVERVTTDECVCRAGNRP